MALLTPYSKIPELNTATILLIENEERFQTKLADAIVQQEKDVNVNVLQAVESSLNYLASDYYLGKVCFVVTDARCGTLAQERMLRVRRLAASHHCPVLCAEHQTEEGIAMAAMRLLTILKVSAGLSPMATTALYLSSLTRCAAAPELDDD
ncbi:centromere protein M isoform X3 [Electrophorus electricus]|uniref:centromere protein M isoform X3 n=1 Tax=Electrophorus electricus TaxID=8005 RepID=UPI0015CF9799|nr:centromere protein M isoform X3 [Electrophorus electricus]